MPTIAPSGNGTHPSTKANMKNNYGTVLHAGNVDTTLMRNIPLTTLATDVGADIGSKVLENDGTGANTTDRAGVAKALSAGTLAYQPDGTDWIIRGYSREYSGVSGAAILNGSDFNPGVQEDNIHQTTSSYAVGSGSLATFNMLARPNGTISPNFSKPANAGSKFNFVKPSGAGNEAATDDAATTSRSVPGELTYRFGGSLPKQDDYKARDTRES